MVLEIWMMVVLVVAFGACAWHCTTVGTRAGIAIALKSLENDKIIKVNWETGRITSSHQLKSTDHIKYSNRDAGKT